MIEERNVDKSSKVTVSCPPICFINQMKPISWSDYKHVIKTWMTQNFLLFNSKTEVIVFGPERSGEKLSSYILTIHLYFLITINYFMVYFFFLSGTFHDIFRQK